MYFMHASIFPSSPILVSWINIMSGLRLILRSFIDLCFSGALQPLTFHDRMIIAIFFGSYDLYFAVKYFGFHLLAPFVWVVLIFPYLISVLHDFSHMLVSSYRSGWVFLLPILLPWSFIVFLFRVHPNIALIVKFLSWRDGIFSFLNVFCRVKSQISVWGVVLIAMIQTIHFDIMQIVLFYLNSVCIWYICWFKKSPLE